MVFLMVSGSADRNSWTLHTNSGAYIQRPLGPVITVHGDGWELFLMGSFFSPFLFIFPNTSALGWRKTCSRVPSNGRMKIVGWATNGRDDSSILSYIIIFSYYIPLHSSVMDRTELLRADFFPFFSPFGINYCKKPSVVVDNRL